MNHAPHGALLRARILRGAAVGVLGLGLAVGVSPLAPTAIADAAPAASKKADNDRKSAQKNGPKNALSKARESAAAPLKKAGKNAGKNAGHAKRKTHEGRPVEQMTAAPLPSRGERVMRAVRAQDGDPYAWGPAGPNRFDCSGLTQYVYRSVGKALPRSSSAQVGHTRRISRGAARPGDLVFFHSGGSVYHVAIYAGGNTVGHAPGTGKRVSRASIWAGSVSFGRVR